MTENVEVQGLPSFDGYVYTGEYRYARDEWALSSFSPSLVYWDGKSPAKVMILRKVK